jgi:hypothetical protein
MQNAPPLSPRITIEPTPPPSESSPFYNSAAYELFHAFIDGTVAKKVLLKNYSSIGQFYGK